MMELDNCPCSGANLPRFVQPVILAVLSSGPLHGYLVVQRLAETSLFRKQPPDATGVYRMLRNMEQEGVLESDWELENSGPARKRYKLHRGRLEVKSVVNVNLLKSYMVKAGYTQKMLAQELGISEQTLTRKLKKRVFGTDEASKIVELLSIDNPQAVFFGH